MGLLNTTITLVPNSIVSVAHKDNHMFIEFNNLSVLSSLQQQQMVVSCLILGKSLILKYTTINATIAAYWGKTTTEHTRYLQ